MLKKHKKHLYDQTALLIFHLYKQHKIDSQEKVVLENLLDQVVLKRKSPELTELLIQWTLHPQSEAKNAIIKDIFSEINFHDERSYPACLAAIKKELGL